MIPEKDLHWLTGFLEGEGCFLKASPSKPGEVAIVVETTDEDVIERVSKLFGVKHYAVPRNNSPTHWKLAYRTVLKGRRSVELMNLLKPFMGIRRQKQITKALKTARLDKDLKRKILTPTERQKVKDLLKDGKLTKIKIGKLFGVNRNTIGKIDSDRKDELTETI